MELTDAEIRRAEARMRALLRRQPHATAARYDRRDARIVVTLSNGLDVGVPVDLAQGLAGAKPAELADIVISSSGLGLHWPRLDADLYLPALLEGVFGNRRWMAQVLGKSGGSSASRAKRKAARANGKLGGRPRGAATA